MEVLALPLLNRFPALEGQVDQLAEVNGRLWEIEEAIRRCEAEQRVDQDFIALARSVYRLNDQRAVIQRVINLASGSRLLEEKNYAQFDQHR